MLGETNCSWSQKWIWWTRAPKPGFLSNSSMNLGRCSLWSLTCLSMNSIQRELHFWETWVKELKDGAPSLENFHGIEKKEVGEEEGRSVLSSSEGMALPFWTNGSHILPWPLLWNQTPHWVEIIMKRRLTFYLEHPLPSRSHLAFPWSSKTKSRQRLPQRRRKATSRLKVSFLWIWWHPFWWRRLSIWSLWCVQASNWCWV